MLSIPPAANQETVDRSESQIGKDLLDKALELKLRKTRNHRGTLSHLNFYDDAILDLASSRTGTNLCGSLLRQGKSIGLKRFNELQRQALGPSEFGLLEKASVLCCFKQLIKIIPNIFEIWMRLPREVDDSMLGLNYGMISAQSSSRSSAERPGVGTIGVRSTRSGPCEPSSAPSAGELFLDPVRCKSFHEGQSSDSSSVRFCEA